MRTPEELFAEIVTHLGGETRLQELGAKIELDEASHVSLRLTRPNPRGVRSVVIAEWPSGLFEMACYGPVRLDKLQAEQLGRAVGIVPESLASVLGMLTGLENLHHRHF